MIPTCLKRLVPNHSEGIMLHRHRKAYVNKRCILFLLAFAPSLSAQSITLVDGDVLRGAILSRSESGVEMESADGPRSVPLKLIAAIEYPAGTEPNLAAAQDRPSPVPVRNQSFSARVGLSPILQMSEYRQVPLEIEHHGTIAPSFGWSTKVLLKMGALSYWDSLIVPLDIIATGPRITLGPGYLEGVHFGILPSLIFEPDIFSDAPEFAFTLEFGFQRISDRSFLFGAFADICFSEYPVFDLGLKLGYAFTGPLFRKRNVMKSAFSRAPDGTTTVLMGELDLLSAFHQDFRNTKPDSISLVLENIETGRRYRVSTDTNGMFLKTGLPAGDYSILKCDTTYRTGEQRLAVTVKLAADLRFHVAKGRISNLGHLKWKYYSGGNAVSLTTGGGHVQILKYYLKMHPEPSWWEHPYAELYIVDESKLR